MDPQLKSLLTTVGMTISTSVAAWAVEHGWIHAADQGAIADGIVTAVGVGVTALLAWYKARQVAPAALIKAVNAGENGVKVVSATASAPTVDTPLRGPGAPGPGKGDGK